MGSKRVPLQKTEDPQYGKITKDTRNRRQRRERRERRERKVPASAETNRRFDFSVLGVVGDRGDDGVSFVSFVIFTYCEILIRQPSIPPTP